MSRRAHSRSLLRLERTAPRILPGSHVADGRHVGGTSGAISNVCLRATDDPPILDGLCWHISSAPANAAVWSRVTRICGGIPLR
jgi:hypothetical protein